MKSTIEKSAVNTYAHNSNTAILEVDVHNHILPYLDNGPENMEMAISLCEDLVKRGFKKCITTPHIMAGYYNNTEELIVIKCKMLNQALEENDVPLQVEYGAEYYLDEHFLGMLSSTEKPITLGRNNNYVLFETSFVEQFNKVIQAVDHFRNMGYRPVLAHPERYVYLDTENGRFEKLQNMGVLFQVNINSLSGYYSKQAKLKVEHLIKHDMVSFLGSNVHKDIEAESLDYAMTNPYFRLALESGRLLNNTLF